MALPFLFDLRTPQRFSVGTGLPDGPQPIPHAVPPLHLISKPEQQKTGQLSLAGSFFIYLPVYSSSWPTHSTPVSDTITAVVYSLFT